MAAVTQQGSFGVMGVGESTVVVTATPGVSTTLVYTDPQGSPTRLEVPAGAVTETVALVFTAVALPTEPISPGLRFAGHAFDLDAYQDGELIPGFSFKTTVTLTIVYSDTDVAGVVEDTLALFRWTGDEWEEIGTRPPETYTLDIENNILTAYLLGFSRFGQFGTGVEHRLFLPLVLKNN
jgi:hypothetical protein